ncbi:MAG: hypothetical protein LBR84_06370 [Tannerella sp.]|jgi:hypothetical protein|nr:hypothetical protein [Tannerella sp.]
MARPIKETPVVYGKDAIRILKEIENPEPLPRERVEEIRRDYEQFRQNPHVIRVEYRN